MIELIIFSEKIDSRKLISCLTSLEKFSNLADRDFVTAKIAVLSSTSLNSSYSVNIYFQSLKEPFHL